MTIKQLAYFLEVAKTASFTSAAENMYISQSSLSKQIKALEDEIGMQLLSRTTRSVELTPAGAACSRYAGEMLRSYEQMMDAVSSLRSVRHGSLHVTMIPAASSYGVPENVMDFCLTYPEIETVVEEQDPSVALKMLFSRRADACIMRSCLLNDKRCRAIPLISDELVMITSVHHPFAKQREISLREAENEQFYLLSEQTHLYGYCVKLCQTTGFTPYVAKQAFRLNTIQNLVSANMGVSLIMKQVALQAQDSSLQIVPLREHPVVDLSVVVKAEDHSDTVRLFINFMRECYGTQ